MVSPPPRSVCLAAAVVLLAAGCAESGRSTDATAGSTESADGGDPTPRDTRTGEETDPLPGTSAPAPETPDAGSPGAGAAPGRCAPGALTATVDPLEPGAGNRYAALVLTNTSDSTCRTRGWPGLQLVAGDGTDIPTTTVRDDSAEPRGLTLPPGAGAWARLRFGAVPGDADPAGECGPDPAALEVIPPDAYSATVAEWELGAVCGAGRIEARPLAEGSGPARQAGSGSRSATAHAATASASPTDTGPGRSTANLAPKATPPATRR
jgi:hypothetical protein